jgi:four helix bundle suffix protein
VSHREATTDAALVLLAFGCSQLAAQARAFEAEGGFTERLYRVRSRKRRSTPSPSFTKSTPSTSD